MKFILKKTLLFMIILIGSYNIFSQKMYTPPLGNIERKEILDIIRKPTQEDLGQAVRFTINTFNILGDWCFVFANIEQSDGKDIDLKKIKKKSLVMGEDDDAFFESGTQVLLKKSSSKWIILKRAIGCTDVCWEDWNKQFNAPKAIFHVK